MSHLATTDPAVAELIKQELERQRSSLELIASENFTSQAVLEATGSVLTNKYSEGYPGKRYYGGNSVIDSVERLAIERAKTLFGAEHANVQPHSGTNANLQAYAALLAPGDRILAMDLAHGGHLTHGSPVSVVSTFYTFQHYGVEKETERLDMDAVRRTAKKVKPALLLAGTSSYPRTLDFAAFRSIADEVGAYFMADIAHIAGLVVTGLHPSPIPFADIVTTTTHKTLRGPRGAIMLAKAAHAKAVDKAVMPGLQGGPLDHVIAAKAVAFHEAMDPSFARYQERVLENARVLAETLASEGLRLISGGTDTPLLLVDVTPLGITGKEAEQALGNAGIFVNKNMIPFDTRKPLDPSGIRLGTPAMTTRGCTADETRRLGTIIASILRGTEDATVLAEARSVVRELAEAHPIYSDLA